MIEHAFRLPSSSLPARRRSQPAEAAGLVEVELGRSSIAPPKYPFSIDTGLADKGKDVFAATCARCHGAQGADGAYPNLLIALETIGADAGMLTGATQFADTYVKWFADSFHDR